MTDPRATGRLRHELRTPVNHIHGYAELLIEDAEDLGRADRVAILGAIRDAGKRALDLVDRIATTDGPGAAEPIGRLLADLEGVAAACDLLAGSATEGAEPASFLADLARIRAACDKLAGRVAEGLREEQAPEAAA